MKASFDFDVIVIGSGFGGSVSACRLAEKGYRVCLLERGQQWGMYEFPRRPNEIKQNLFWDPEDQKYGMMEIRDYTESDLMSVTASGLGGGSLIYANVLMRMPPEFFQNWPGSINRNTLDPFYDKVLDMMEASPYPIDRDPYYKNTNKTNVFKMAADQLSTSSESPQRPEFILPDLAINFNGNFPGEQRLNKHGALQSKCIKCGECDIGCNIHAKNTLDLNYLFRARKLNVEIRTLAQVTDIELNETKSGYIVTYMNPKSTDDIKKISAEKVILSAGSLGSTALLLKMKQNKKLPNISSKLGKNWCGNGDLEGTILNTKHQVEPSLGPVITGAIRYYYNDYSDGFKHGLFIQDAGFPIGLAWYLSAKIPQPKLLLNFLKIIYRYLKSFVFRFLHIKQKISEVNIGDDFANLFERDDFIRQSFLLLGMGRDRSDGEIQLREDGQPVIKWKIEKSKLHYDRVRSEMKNIATAMGGEFIDNPITHIDKIVAVHPIGGCIMADDCEHGVVSTKGEVFGYPGLYVIDASTIPTSLGPNPSLTIAALAEYFMDQFPNN